MLFALKRLPSLIEANIKRKQSAFVILREISWNFSFEIFLLLNCLDSDLQRWANDLVKFLKKQTKLEKKKKLWYLFFFNFWPLLPESHFSKGDWALGSTSTQFWDFSNNSWFPKILNLDSHLPKKTSFYLVQWKPFTSDEKCFLFHLKSFFRSRDI